VGTSAGYLQDDAVPLAGGSDDDTLVVHNSRNSRSSWQVPDNAFALPIEDPCKKSPARHSRFGDGALRSR
jgi:hypothetical protein